MKTVRALACFLVLFCLELHAQFGYQSNHFTPYPPSCGTLPDLNPETPDPGIAKVATRRIALRSGFDRNTPLDVDMHIYRVACAEAGRSTIWIEFESVKYDYYYYVAPNLSAQFGVDGNGQPLALVREANQLSPGIWPSNADLIFGGYDASGWSYDTTWTFLLDNPTPFWWYVGPGHSTSPSAYNSAFRLWVYGFDEEDPISIEIPSTETLFDSQPGLPLSGRLAGNWVSAGATDQGFVISVSEQVDAVETGGTSLPWMEVRPMVLFLSWYTYGPDGEPLWLTGAGTFEAGEQSVSIPIEFVRGGAFLGSQAAERRVVGDVHLTAHHCNDLTLEYELEDIGLGSGSTRLMRPHSLEPAGYACREFEARIEALSTP